MGLTLIKPDVHLDFIGLRRIAFIISALVVLIGLGSLFIKGGPKLGIDFAGGIMVQLKFQDPVELKTLQAELGKANLPDPVIQSFGAEGEHEYLVRVATTDVDSNTVRTEIESALEATYANAYEIQRLEMVGPKVGADLRSKALEALFYAVLLIAIYISGRFEQRWWAAGIMAACLAGAMYGLRLLSVPTGYLTLIAMAVTLVLCWRLTLNYALGAVVALIHDVLITVGVFSLLGKEFDLTIIAALLTIIGYSLNDTIIVFDRIRENLRSKAAKTFTRTINLSINQTLSRTILTSGTTLLVVLALYFLGGGVIHDFAFALLIGVFVGTYSSIFVASPILLAFAPDLEEAQLQAGAEQ